MLKQFGGSITPIYRKEYEKSPNWKDGKFQNLLETDMSATFRKMPQILYKQFTNTAGRTPKQNIPVQSFDKAAFLKESDSTKMIWFGHSVVLFRMNGKTLLIDPMLGNTPAPFSTLAPKRYSKDVLSIIDQLPEIDLVLLTHDHYDHLDYPSIKALQSKVKKYYVALGVERHLICWGIDADHITTFDWWDQINFHGIDITFTPSRHFSGRGLRDRFQSLWGGWVFNNQKENIYFSGDGGFGNHFQEVGKKLGPFDFGLMECGQYNAAWANIHLSPEESVQAAIDANVKKAMPVHWGAFTLAHHGWKEPVERFIKAIKTTKMSLATSPIGACFQINEDLNQFWWKEFE